MILILTRFCSCCKTKRPVEKFVRREDRPGYYAWCMYCMCEQKRRVDIPALEERGFGTLGNKVPD